MNDLFAGRSRTIRQVSGSKAGQKAFYRFLGNENVTEKELTEGCCERTGILCAGKHVLLVNDTSEINLDSHKGRLAPGSGIGVVGNNRDIGFFAHLGLAIDLEANQALGFSSIQLWNREATNVDGREISKLKIEDKESYKWLQCGYDSKELLKAAAKVTIVGDRESDIYELLADIPDERVHLIVRNRFNRRTNEGEGLYNLLEKTSSEGSYKIQVGGDHRKKTKNRNAVLAVKYRETFITKPQQKKDDRPEQIKVWIVEAKEEGKKEGICWRLVTTHEVKDFAGALQIIEWYKMRWWIEEVFRLLKSKGYRIEDSQLESGWAIRKLTIMLLQTILRVMQMLIAYGSDEEQDGKIAFTESEISCLEKVGKKEEGETDKLKNKHKKGTLKWATWIIARLGGWSGYESQRPPGPITLKNGLDKFQNMYAGWCIAMETLGIDVGTQ